MPSTYSKPLTDYFDTLPNNQRGKLQERKNISDYNVALQELFDQWMLHDEPEIIEEIASGGDLVSAHFVESDSDVNS
jgi:hypothetical protein